MSLSAEAVAVLGGSPASLAFANSKSKTKKEKKKKSIQLKEFPSTFVLFS